MKILVLGDRIVDKYRHFKATRLCPEAPVPVLVEDKDRAYSSEGGAGLVYEQLHEFFPAMDAVTFIPGSYSTKERIFADGHLVARIDSDQEWSLTTEEYHEKIARYFEKNTPNAIVISDYAKGALRDAYRIGRILEKANSIGIPVFVDAKINWSAYNTAFAAFPNEVELAANPQLWSYFKHTIAKRGEHGCQVDGVHIPLEHPHAVRDVTGAGDIFLAAFVYNYLTAVSWSGSLLYAATTPTEKLRNSARFANKVAGISVEHVGTYVVTRKELDNLGEL